MGGGDGGGGNGGGRDLKKKKNAFSFFLEASGNKNIGTTIRIGREIECFPYAGFLLKFYL